LYFLAYTDSVAKAIIIGAGPAGTVAGILLARAGFVVELIEQQVFPRGKVCGECLSGVGMDVLERAGLLGAMVSERPAELVRSLLHPTDGPMIEVPLPRASMGISRLRMDTILLDSAVNAGVRVHQPARCEAIETTPVTRASRPCVNSLDVEQIPFQLHSDQHGLEARVTVARSAGPSVRWRNLQTNELADVQADWILVGDGKGSLLSTPRKATGDLGIKTHFANVNGPRDAIELFAGQGNYGGLAAVENNRWNAAFSVPALMVKKYAGDLQAMFDDIVIGNPSLGQRLAGAKRIGPWLASPLPRFAVSGSWQPRVIPIGNAAAALEPVGGEGMGLAMRSAELAASAIVQADRTGDHRSVQTLPGVFNELWALRRTVCRSIAMMFSSERVANAVAPLIEANLKIPETLMRLAGKAGGS
jgi:menaquinone-9 beta-reductase